MKSLNLGILAHVDAGKTSLTESILFHAGVIDEPGRVDDGSTQTDTLELEKKRGITIQSSVVSFNINTNKINLIDTPGHADFISEVERALSVLDAVILVISAVEGIQAQTRILMNALKKMKKPTLIFINKVDRKGAENHALLKTINEQLKITAIPMVKVNNIGNQNATVEHLTTQNSTDYMYLLEFLTDNDELFLNKSIENDLSLSKQDVLQQIIKQTLSANIYPVYFGSAINGIGIKELFIGIEYYLPCQQANDEISASGSIFKIERTDNNEKIFYIDLKAGKLEVRKPINFYQSSEEGTILINEKISRIKVFEQGKLINTPTMHAGSIAQVFGLKSAKIGDTLGEPSEQSLQTTFSRPTLETNIKACNPAKQEKLFVKLKELADQDPLISLHKNSSSHSLCIKLYGEIQKEVIKERLESEYDIKVEFGKTKMICIERPLQTGHAANIMDLHNAPLEYYATLGFKIEPGEIDSGIVYRIDGHAGSLPKGYHSVVKESVFQFLETGLHGWQVTDCIITMTDSGVCPLSIAPHFRQLTPLLMKKALQQAQTVICEPFHAFELEIPLSTLNNVLVELSHVNAKIDSGNTVGDLYYIQGEILAQHVQTIQSILPGLTQGRGTIITNHAGYINN